MSAPYTVVRMDPDRIVTAVDDAFVRLLGSKAEVVGAPFSALIAARDRAGMAAYHRSISGYGEGYARFIANVRVDAVTHLTRVAMWRDGEGWAAAVEPVPEDDPICELLVRREHWSALTRTSTEGVCVLDPEGRILETNARFLELLEPRSRHGVAMTRDSIVGRRLDELIGEDEIAIVAQDVRSLSRSRSRLTRTRRVEHRERLLDARLSPIKGPGGRLAGACLAMRDRTHDQRMSDLRASAARRAGMAEMASGLLHNVGNVVTGLGVGVRLAREQTSGIPDGQLERAVALLAGELDQAERAAASGGPGERVAVALKYLRRAVADVSERKKAVEQSLLESVDHIDHIASIIQRKPGGGPVRPVLVRCRPSEVVQDAVRLSRFDAKTAIQLEFDSIADDPLECDRGRLLQILINLVNNACEALRDTAQPRLRVASGVDHGALWFEVSDNGCGIRDEHRPRLFDHGFTTKPEGHGFGLHNSALAAEEMGGRLSAHSQGPDRGAVFRLELPGGTG